MNNNCGHCNGTGACDCKACSSGKVMCNTTQEKLGDNFVNYYGYSNLERNYYECSKCNGTGVITPSSVVDNCVHCLGKGVCNCVACVSKIPKSFNGEWRHLNGSGYANNGRTSDYSDVPWHICSICEGAGIPKQNNTYITLSNDSSEEHNSEETIKLLVEKVAKENDLVEKRITLSENRHQ